MDVLRYIHLYTWHKLEGNHFQIYIICIDFENVYA